MRRNKHMPLRAALLATSLGCAALFAPGAQAAGLVAAAARRLCSL